MLPAVTLQQQVTNLKHLSHNTTSTSFGTHQDLKKWLNIRDALTDQPSWAADRRDSAVISHAEDLELLNALLQHC